MRGNELLQGMTEVDNDLILESENAFHQKKKTVRARRWLAAAACLCLCFCCTVPALAASGNPLAYEALYSIFPSIAQKLKPVNASCEDNGIEMTVVAAEIDGEKATVLVSMRDKSGNRLDETTDLFDSYSIHTPYDQSGGCSLVSYDADTKTATFMLTIEQMQHVLIVGDKITFSVSQLLSKKEYSNIQLSQINPENVQSITEFVKSPDVRGGGGIRFESADGNSPLLMEPDETNAVDLTNGVALTGYGSVEGELHVQLRYNDIRNTDNHGYVYLKTQDGEKLDCESDLAFWDESHRNSYEEYIFPVSSEELSDYEIWGEFWTCNSGPIKGDWQVTIPMTDRE